MHWLVIGYGNDLAGDDGVGIAVAEEVKNLMNRASIEKEITVKVITKRILAPELVENIRVADGVVFIDASTALAPGRLVCTDLQSQKLLAVEEECGSPSMLLSHSCNPVTLLQLSHTLFDYNPPAWLYAVGASHFDLTENLSETVALVVPQVAGQIIDQICNYALKI